MTKFITINLPRLNSTFYIPTSSIVFVKESTQFHGLVTYVTLTGGYTIELEDVPASEILAKIKKAETVELAPQS